MLFVLFWNETTYLQHPIDQKSIMILQILYLKYFTKKILKLIFVLEYRGPLIRCCHSFAVLESRP